MKGNRREAVRQRSHLSLASVSVKGTDWGWGAQDTPAQTASQDGSVLAKGAEASCPPVLLPPLTFHCTLSFLASHYKVPSFWHLHQLWEVLML